MIKPDCKKCICSKCKAEFNTSPQTCKYSDCKWCKYEKGYVERCNKYIEKGGTYGEVAR